MAQILIVDDSTVFCDVTAEVFRGMGHVVACAHTLAAGLEALANQPDVVFLDVDLPDGNGIKALSRFLRQPVAPEVIVVTAYVDPEAAAEAMDAGAWDYVEKESSLETLRHALQVAVRYRVERRQGHAHTTFDRSGIIGESPCLLACLKRTASAAATNASILLTGETGTGKELFARVVHHNSPRRRGPFVVLDGSAVPAPLSESIFFGHVKGAFTGALKTTSGLLGQATGGTLFLDEVGELPLDIQKRLLRVLQERRFRPVGGAAEVESDFRLVAATNRDLSDMVAAGEFRSDLLYRLNIIEIRLPALRERLSDIPLLTDYILGRKEGREHVVSAEFLEALRYYNWPGNVRELVNALETAMVGSDGTKTLYPKYLPSHIRQYLARRTVSSRHPKTLPRKSPEGQGVFKTWKEQRNAAVEAAAKEYFVKLLRHVDGDIGLACQHSALSQQHFYATLKKYNLKPWAWRMN